MEPPLRPWNEGKILTKQIENARTGMTLIPIVFLHLVVSDFFDIKKFRSGNRHALTVLFIAQSGEMFSKAAFLSAIFNPYFLKNTCFNLLLSLFYKIPMCKNPVFLPKWKNYYMNGRISPNCDEHATHMNIEYFAL